MKKSVTRPMMVKRKVASSSKVPNMIFKLNDDCVAEVLSYLTLDDVNRFIKSDKRFRPAAKIRFAQGGFDVIDPTFLKKYPQDVLDDIIESYGKRANQMKFKLLPEENLFPTISQFHVLTELILSEVEFSEFAIHDHLPKRLHSLDIDRCIIPDELLRKWCLELNGTLNKLRIVHRNPISSVIGKRRPSYVGLKELNHITSLLIDGYLDHSIIASVIDQNNEHLRSLTLLCGQTPGPNRSTLTKELWTNIMALRMLNELHLEHLYYIGKETPPSGLFPELTLLHIQFCELRSLIDNLACESTLHSLIIEVIKPTPSSLMRFRNLKHVELLRMDWSSGDDILEWCNLKQVETLILKRSVFNSVDDVTVLAESMLNLRKLTVEQVFFWAERTLLAETVEKQVKRKLKKRSKPFEFEFSIFNLHSNSTVSFNFPTLV